MRRENKNLVYIAAILLWSLLPNTRTASAAAALSPIPSTLAGAAPYYHNTATLWSLPNVDLPDALLTFTSNHLWLDGALTLVDERGRVRVWSGIGWVGNVWQVATDEFILTTGQGSHGIPLRFDLQGLSLKPMTMVRLWTYQSTLNDTFPPANIHCGVVIRWLGRHFSYRDTSLYAGTNMCT